MRLAILYEDDYLVAVNKPARIVVHTTARDPRRLNVQGLLERHLGRKLTLFHRLDADTTGVLLLGKKRSINAAINSMFADHRVRKAYWAVVRGVWRREWNRIETTTQRRGRSDTALRAVSTFRVLASASDRSWIEVLPKTGRTHQIRLHCASKGCPIMGDPIHDAGHPAAASLALHARQLDFRHPVTREALRIAAPVPEYWRTVWLVGLSVES